MSLRRVRPSWGVLPLVNFEQNINDRKLGHEWYGWDGNIDTHEGFIREPKRLFMGVLFLVFAFVFALACVAVWLIHPRLTSLHPVLGDLALGAIAVVVGAFFTLYATLSYALLRRKPLWVAQLVTHGLFMIFPMLARVAGLFNISKDRLGYSLLEIHNDLTRNFLRKVSSGRILCLAPRCLDRETFKQLKALTCEYDCDLFIAATGAQARQRVVQIKPAGIIAIACERDLVSGIREVGYRIPVIGIANKRPIGPCKGAFIEPHELREAIEIFKTRLDLESSMEDPRDCAMDL